MSPDADWLERLAIASDYRQLQEIFSEMAAQARTGSNRPELARSIDEAIRRLEEERAGDEEELGEIRTLYQEFQEQHRGLVGWLKRHIPFTRARRQEVGHREDIADQQAEILADNLVIARAQMLKEGILDTAHRRLGRRPTEWRAELTGRQTAGQLGPLVELVRALADEIDRSALFLAEVRRDIEAFAGADFKTPDDRQRRDADLAAGRHELDALEQEVKEETSLKRGGLPSLATLVAAELSTADAGFRSDGARLKALRTAIDRLQQSLSATASLATAAVALGDLVRQLAALPAEIEQLRDTIQRADADRDQAALASARNSAVVDERRTRCDEARRGVEQKQRELTEAQRLYQSSRPAPSEKTMPLPVEADPASPLGRRLSEAKTGADAAQASLQEVTGSYEAARQADQAAQSALAEATRTLDAQRRKLSDLERRLPQLRREFVAAAERGQREFAVAAGAVAAFLDARRALGSSPEFSADLGAAARPWIDRGGLDRSLADALFDAERDYQRHLQAMNSLDQLRRWQEAQRQALGREQSTLRSRREAAFKDRLRQLLGDSLADEASAATTLD